MPALSFHIITPGGEVRRGGSSTVTTIENPPPAQAGGLHSHLTDTMHLLLDTLDQHPEVDLSGLHICTDSDGSIRILVKGSGVPVGDRLHAVDVLAEAFRMPHAEASPVAYAAQAGHSAVWTVTRSEATS